MKKKDVFQCIDSLILLLNKLVKWQIAGTIARSGNIMLLILSNLSFKDRLDRGLMLVLLDRAQLVIGH